MSLRVWLPLIKDAHNQGASDLSPSVMGSVTYTAGKLGNAATFTGNAANCIHMPGLKQYDNFSWACWLKVSATTSNAYQFILSEGRDYERYGVNLYLVNSSRDLRIDYGGYNTGIGNTLQSSLALNTWYHVAFTISSSGCVGYINGTPVTMSGDSIGTWNYSKPDYTYSNDKFTIGKMAYSYTSTTYYFPFNGQICDVRIYDHCLSLKEVKDLAKGLVAHYPLNPTYFNQNLINDPYPASTTNWYVAGSGWSMSLVGADFSLSGKAIRTTASTANVQGGVYIGTGGFSSLDNGGTYTLSAYMRANKASTVILNQEMFTSADPSIYYMNVTTQWKRYEVTGVIDTSKTYKACIFYMTASSVTAGSWLEICMVKLEKSSKATPWTPTSSDTAYTALGFNSNILYDTSGFGHNATITGTLSANTNTLRYSTCAYFNGSSYAKTLPGELSWSNFDTLTVAAWMKPTTTPSGFVGGIGIAHEGYYSTKYFGISNYAGKFEVGTSDGSNYIHNTSSYTMPLNVWHHYAATLEGTALKMYVDGELVHSATISWGNTTLHASPQIQIGVDLPGGDEIYTGYYSDARIYATALSQNAVKELCKPVAFIDNARKIQAFELNGLDNTITKAAITNTGVLKAKGSGVKPNIAYGSRDFSNFSYNGSWTTSVDADGFTVKSYSVSTNTSNIWARVVSQNIVYGWAGFGDGSSYDLRQGITVSFSFKCDDVSAWDVQIPVALQMYNSSGTRIGWYEPSITSHTYTKPLQSNKWTHIVAMFTNANLSRICVDGYTASNISYFNVSFCMVKNGSIHFKNVKIEPGLYPTPWTTSDSDSDYVANNDGFYEETCDKAAIGQDYFLCEHFIEV